MASRAYVDPDPLRHIEVTVLEIPATAKKTAMPVGVPKQKPPKKPPAPKNKLERQQEEMRARAVDAMPEIKKVRYTKKEAAWSLGMCVRSLEYRIRARLIKLERDGRRRYITQAEIDRYNKTDHAKSFRPSTTI